MNGRVDQRKAEVMLKQNQSSSAVRSLDHGLDVAVEDRKKRRLILIFSDQMKTDDAWCRSLEAYGYKVSVAACAGAVSGGPLQFHPVAMVVDLSSSESIAQSLEVIARLREEGRLDIPVIMIGDRKDVRMRIETVRAGVTGFLNRPVAPLALVETLDRLTSSVRLPYRVLLVDDSKSQSIFMADLLSKAGMETRVANNLDEVMDPLEGFRPEVIIMDLTMPEATGDEIVSVIRQEEDYATIPIIYVSAEQDLDRQNLAMRRGGDDFITKPFDAERFVDSVKHRVKRFRQLRDLVEKDSLTGLVKHSHMFRMVDNCFVNVRETGTPYCYAIFDIDFFKQVNDTYGHDTGDLVIKSFARCLRERTRLHDVAGRIGGEEFALIMPKTDIIGAATTADWLREEFSRITHTSGKLSFNCTVSVGVASFIDFNTALDMRNAADAALYASKGAGRNRITCADEME